MQTNKILVTYFTDKELYYFELPMGTWVVNGKEHTVANYQKEQITSLQEPVIFKVNAQQSLVSFENAVSGTVISVDTYMATELEYKNKGNWCSIDQELTFAKLEDEFEYKKFLRDWKPAYELITTKEQFQTEVRHAMLDTGNEYIKPMFCIDSTKPELVQVFFASYQMKVVKDWCNKHVLGNYEIPTHSHLEYAKIAGKYVFNGSRSEFNGQNSVRSMHYEDAVKLLDNEKKKLEGMLYAVLCSIKAIPDVSVKELIDEIEAVRKYVGEKAYTNKVSKISMGDTVSKDLKKIVTRLQNISAEMQTSL